jgi:hypothetical protein
MEKSLIVMGESIGKMGKMPCSSVANVASREREGLKRTHFGGFVDMMWRSSMGKNSAIHFG